ncbi:MAG TPA: hypothetical protein VG477_17930 [Thermoanaerobaculia bacterium]|nr:hypothetical protein [Thermoanaerobaculia bacterium]
MKPAHPLLILTLILALFTLGTIPAKADPPGKMNDFAGSYFAGLPERAEVLQLHEDGTAGQNLSDQVTSGAGGFTFADSVGSWKITGPRTVFLRFLNLNFDVSGVPTYIGVAVVDYTLQFAPDFRTFSASCLGKIYPTGQDPFAPGSTPIVEFDCAYLNGYLYQRVPLE